MIVETRFRLPFVDALLGNILCLCEVVKLVMKVMDGG